MRHIHLRAKHQTFLSVKPSHPLAAFVLVIEGGDGNRSHRKHDMKKMIFVGLLGMTMGMGTSFGRDHGDTFPRTRTPASEDKSSTSENIQSESPSNAQNITEPSKKESSVNWRMIRDPGGRK